jgi:hypothetical protein
MNSSDRNSNYEDCLFFILLLIPHFFRFPELSLTAFPHGLWVWLEPLMPQPSASLPTPIKLFVASVLMLFVGCYILAHMWQSNNTGSGTAAYRLKVALVLGTFALVVYVPMLHEMSLRRMLGPETHAHDGAILIEEAIKKTLQGRNAYTEDYYGTPLEQSGFADPRIWRRLGVETYPALEHFVYPPFAFLIPLPFYPVAKAAFGWFDLRLILLPAYLVFMLCSYALPKRSERKIVALQFAALNPYLATFLITGRSEALPLAALTTALFFLEKRPAWAQVFLGIACLSKQYVWLIVPFVGLFLIRERAGKFRVKTLVSLVAGLWLFWVVFFGGMLPYAIWDFPALLRGVVLHSGAHPIKGVGAYGFGTWVLFFGWVENAAAKFPFLLIQAVVTLPLFVLCLAWQTKKNDISRMMLGAAACIFVFFYFSRYFHDSYFGVITALLALSYCTAPDSGTVAGEG